MILIDPTALHFCSLSTLPLAVSAADRSPKKQAEYSTQWDPPIKASPHLKKWRWLRKWPQWLCFLGMHFFSQDSGRVELPTKQRCLSASKPCACSHSHHKFSGVLINFTSSSSLIYNPNLSLLFKFIFPYSLSMLLSQTRCDLFSSAVLSWQGVGVVNSNCSWLSPHWQHDDNDDNDGMVTQISCFTSHLVGSVHVA